MLNALRLNRIVFALIAWALAAAALPTPQAWAESGSSREAEPSRSAKAKPRLDRSGDPRVGEASIYANKFAGQKMADGTRMDPQDDNAASKTLPLGTKAKVTNLETGRSTVVTIQDRGPHVEGRIIDLPLGKAEEIGLTLKQGVAQVEVDPIDSTLADGVKLSEQTDKRK